MVSFSGEEIGTQIQVKTLGKGDCLPTKERALR